MCSVQLEEWVLEHVHVSPRKEQQDMRGYLDYHIQAIHSGMLGCLDHESEPGVHTRFAFKLILLRRPKGPYSIDNRYILADARRESFGDLGGRGAEYEAVLKEWEIENNRVRVVLPMCLGAAMILVSLLPLGLTVEMLIPIDRRRAAAQKIPGWKERLLTALPSHDEVTKICSEASFR